jgi:hypothetical protein
MIDDRARWRAAGIALLGLAVLACVLWLNPTNLPESWIQRWVEKKLPLGSSIVAVRQTIEKEGWKTIDESINDSFSTVIVRIGETWLPRQPVYVWFSFDRFGRLAALRVTKGGQPMAPSYMPLD